MNERAIFIEALDKGTPAERAAYLDAVCGGDEALRRQVEALLRSHDAAGTFLRRPVPDRLAGGPARGEDGPTPPPATAGGRIGPYKLLQQIGAGGMGVVYLAEQTHPVRRRVALKVIRPGMDSEQVVARFEAERQALAMMDHVGIARVFDGGTTRGEPGGGGPGRPYFVMELVHGVPITRYCDDHHLTPRERLELFVQVCQAVQHAHQKGVIHRDLKPSNVLVTTSDGKPVPKVIDFGVAKAIEQKLTERTLFTQYGTMVGTLEYMSPEQAEMTGPGVDTRSDIYSLGVLLYELLTGSTPLTTARLKGAGFAEILRLILEEEPPRPSTRLGALDETLPAISAHRKTEPAKLTRLVRGDLDWIVMKALEKDRDRRYETAGDLAADVRRHLADEPVQACPPSAGYRVRKFVRRHKQSVATATLVGLALLGGIIGTTAGMLRAERAREAEEARAEGEHRAKEVAEKRLAQVETGIDVLGSLFEDLDPFAEEKDGRPLRAVLGDRLDQVAADLDGDAVGDPLVVARLQDRLGQTYLALGQPAKAEALFVRAHATRAARLGEHDPLALASAGRLAVARFDAGHRVEAIAQFEQVRDAQVETLGVRHPDTLTTLHNLGWTYRLAGRPADAVRLLEQVRDGRVEQLGPDHDQTLLTLQKLAGAYMAAQKRTEAVDLLRQVLDRRVARHGRDHPHAIAAMNDLGYAYQYAFRMKEAIDLFQRASDASAIKFGDYHPLTLSILTNLGNMHRAYGRTTKAITLLEEVRERRLMTSGGHHPATLATLHGLALAYRDAEDPGKALPLFQQAAAGVERLRFAHGDAPPIIYNLCACLEGQHRLEEAEVWRRKWLAAVEGQPGTESPEYPAALTALGANLLRQKKYEQAEPHLVQGYEAAGPADPGPALGHHGSPTTGPRTEALERLVQLYDAWEKKDKADEWRRKLAAARPNRPGAKAPVPEGKSD